MSLSQQPAGFVLAALLSTALILFSVAASADPKSVERSHAQPHIKNSTKTVAYSAKQRKERQQRIQKACREFDRRLRSVRASDCRRDDWQLADAQTVKGRPILYVDYLPDTVIEPDAKVLLMGGIHGDELSSVSVVFRWMKRLDREHDGRIHWRIIPSANPDGIISRPASRMNANGVDLNRNFPAPNWVAETTDYWVRRTRKNKRRYPGPAALSEPESAWISSQIDEFQPDVIVSVHAPLNLVDFDGNSEPPRKLGNLYLSLLGTYPGSMGNYGRQLDIPVLTPELPNAWSMPSHKDSQRIWRDLTRWVEENVRSRTETQTAAETVR